MRTAACLLYSILITLILIYVLILINCIAVYDALNVNIIVYQYVTTTMNLS